jgi:hypothetical protein
MVRLVDQNTGHLIAPLSVEAQSVADLLFHNMARGMPFGVLNLIAQLNLDFVVVSAVSGSFRAPWESTAFRSHCRKRSIASRQTERRTACFSVPESMK